MEIITSIDVRWIFSIIVVVYCLFMLFNGLKDISKLDRYVKGDKVKFEIGDRVCVLDGFTNNNRSKNFAGTGYLSELVGKILTISIVYNKNGIPLYHFENMVGGIFEYALCDVSHMREEKLKELGIQC